MSAASLPAPDLTLAELALVSAYRTMDDRAKSETLEEAKGAAVRWPRSPVPILRLVTGGAA
jgi:hypothetical protein